MPRKPLQCDYCGSDRLLVQINGGDLYRCEACLEAPHADDKFGLYVAWLMQSKKLDLREAIVYATGGGQPALDRLKASDDRLRKARSQEMHERAQARVADMEPSLRRWYNLDRPCPFKGCIEILGHSGKHRVPNKLVNL